MGNLKIRFIRNKSEYEKVLKIRTAVFIKEQKVPRDIEMDECENTSWRIIGGSGRKYIIAFYGKRAIGCGRLRFTDGKAKLERVAVLKRYRNKGFGTLILKYMVKYAKRKNPKEIYMHAQYYLKDYYAKQGFRPAGRIFYEAGIKHIKMRLVNKPRAFLY